MLRAFPGTKERVCDFFVLSTDCIKTLCLKENIYVMKFNVMTHWWVASHFGFFHKWDIFNIPC